MVTIIDLKISNIYSVVNALNYLGKEVTVANNADQIMSAECLILPGVGSFSAGMDAINKMGIACVLHDAIGAKIPILGICLGMQLLYQESEESKGVPGLGIFPHTATQLTLSEDIRLPHMCWSTVKARGSYFQSFDSTDFYFSHSFGIRHDKIAPQNALICDYGNNQFIAAIKEGNVFGAQFHPEKSRKTGLNFLNHFLEYSKELTC